MPRRGRGGLFSLIGQGIGAASEYREHRRQQHDSREAQQQQQPQPHEQHLQDSSSRPPQEVNDLPPAYADVAQSSDISLATGEGPSGDAKRSTSPYDGDSDVDSTSSLGDESIEDDEEDWELDEAAAPSDSAGLPSYEESEAMKEHETVDDLVRDVFAASALHKDTPNQANEIRPYQTLPCPVVIPQRRPRKKARGFVRAYAPVLGDCCGIDQKTFLSFLKNFHKASQSSPVFTAIQISSSIAGFAPSVIAMAVTTAVSIAAGVGAEVQSRTRTNNFLDRMNEELFKPAGVYAMIIKYKSDKDLEQAANPGALGALTNLIRAEQVDMSTNEVIAKYNHGLTEEAAGQSSQSMSNRMQNMRLASDTTRGTIALPAAAPLIFPNVDYRLDHEGPETFKDKAKDAQKFLADYMDRRAQMQYANQDPNSTLAVPENQRAFHSKMADPKHPMYSGGLVALLSGGKATPRMEKRERRRERALEKDARRIERGKGLKHELKRSRRYGDDYHDELRDRIGGNGKLAVSRGMSEESSVRSSGRGSTAGSSTQALNERRQGGRRAGRGQRVGMVKRLLREDVLYLLIANMPSDAELAEARAELDSAKGRS